jgi:hypothetical protein
MDFVADRSDWERHMFQLRKSLEHAVEETGSLTNARVLQISSMLDQAVLAELRRQGDPTQ